MINIECVTTQTTNKFKKTYLNCRQAYSFKQTTINRWVHFAILWHKRYLFTRNWQHTRQSLIWGVHSRSFLPDYYDRKIRPSDKTLNYKLKIIDTTVTFLLEPLRILFNRYIFSAGIRYSPQWECWLNQTHCFDK